MQTYSNSDIEVGSGQIVVMTAQSHSTRTVIPSWTIVRNARHRATVATRLLTLKKLAAMVPAKSSGQKSTSVLDLDPANKRKAMRKEPQPEEGKNTIDRAVAGKVLYSGEANPTILEWMAYR